MEWTESASAQPSIFKPHFASSRDPRQAAETNSDSQYLSRDPRQVHVPMFVPQPVRPPQQQNGFQPICPPQPPIKPRRPSFQPQLRPMTDPFASFGHNHLLKMKVREALLSERSDFRSARGSQPPPTKRSKLAHESVPVVPNHLLNPADYLQTADSRDTSTTEATSSGRQPVSSGAPAARGDLADHSSAAPAGGGSAASTAQNAAVPRTRPIRTAARKSRAKSRANGGVHVTCFIPNGGEPQGSKPPSRSNSPLPHLHPSQPGSLDRDRSSTPSVPPPGEKTRDLNLISGRARRSRDKSSSLAPDQRESQSPTASSQLPEERGPTQQKDGPGRASKDKPRNPAVNRLKKEAQIGQNTKGSNDVSEEQQKRRQPQGKRRKESPRQARPPKAKQPRTKERDALLQSAPHNRSQITILGSSEYAADWEASRYFRLKDTSAREAVLQLRSDAIAFAFPVPKSEWPIQDTRKLNAVPLRPLQAALQEGDAALPAQLSQAQVELLARFRCSKWHEEKALPAITPPLASSTPLKRRSARIRTAPASFTPFFGRRREKIDSEGADLRTGDEYQAELPACVPKPPAESAPTAEEALWLEHFVMSAGRFGPPDQAVPVHLVHETASHQREYACGAGMDCLVQAAQIFDLGLDKVGSACAPGWTPADIRCFEKGLNECKRDFAHIASNYLPHKGCHQVGDFYYNVWKTKAIPEAKAWYHKRDEARQQEEEAERAAELQRDQAQAQGLVRRQIKESLIWLKLLAREPLDQAILRTKAERVKKSCKALADANIEKSKTLLPMQ